MRLNNKPGFPGSLSTQFYRFITHCQTNLHVSEETRRSCEYGGTSLEDFVPVSSRTGDKVFKNKHCAKCHGFFDIVYWNLFLVGDCKSVISQTFSSQIEMEAYILKTCFLHTEPIRAGLGDMVSCQYNGTLISTCSIPSLWNEHENATEEKCLLWTPQHNTQFTQYYNSQTLRPTKKRVFRNIFCYLCNTEEKNQESGDSCLSYHIESLRNLRKYTFSLLISLPKGNSISKGTYACSESEYFDSYHVS